MPSVTSASSLVNPKSSRKKMRTKTEGTAQLHGWVMGLTSHSLYPTPVPRPAPSALPQAVAFSPPTSFSQTSSPVERDWGSARTECYCQGCYRTARLPPPLSITSPTHPRSLWGTALQPRSQTWSGATTHPPSGFWGSRHRALWRHTLVTGPGH